MDSLVRKSQVFLLQETFNETTNRMMNIGGLVAYSTTSLARNFMLGTVITPPLSRSEKQRLKQKRRRMKRRILNRQIKGDHQKALPVMQPVGQSDPNSDTPPQQTLGKEAASTPLTGKPHPIKLAVVPADYPETMFSEDHCKQLQRKLLELVIAEESVVGPLQVQMTYLDKGSLVVTCGDEVTSSWLRKVASDIKICERLTVVVGDYKDIIQTPA